MWSGLWDDTVQGATDSRQLRDFPPKPFGRNDKNRESGAKFFRFLFFMQTHPLPHFSPPETPDSFFGRKNFRGGLIFRELSRNCKSCHRFEATLPCSRGRNDGCGKSCAEPLATVPCILATCLVPQGGLEPPDLWGYESRALATCIAVAMGIFAPRDTKRRRSTVFCLLCSVHLPGATGRT